MKAKWFDALSIVAVFMIAALPAANAAPGATGILMGKILISVCFSGDKQATAKSRLLHNANPFLTCQPRVVWFSGWEVTRS